jgi:hypothetical protein
MPELDFTKPPCPDFLHPQQCPHLPSKPSMSLCHTPAMLSPAPSALQLWPLLEHVHLCLYLCKAFLSPLHLRICLCSPKPWPAWLSLLWCLTRHTVSAFHAGTYVAKITECFCLLHFSIWQEKEPYVITYYIISPVVYRHRKCLVNILQDEFNFKCIYHFNE